MFGIRESWNSIKLSLKYFSFKAPPMHKDIQTYFGENLLWLNRILEDNLPVPEMYLFRRKIIFPNTRR